jgi:hypothetical protein
VRESEGFLLEWFGGVYHHEEGDQRWRNRSQCSHFRCHGRSLNQLPNSSNVCRSGVVARSAKVTRVNQPRTTSIGGFVSVFPALVRTGGGGGNVTARMRDERSGLKPQQGRVEIIPEKPPEKEASEPRRGAWTFFAESQIRHNEGNWA